MIINNAGYYVKRLPENPVNKYKWLYIDSSDGNLNIVDNKWYFDIKFYLIQNLSLPLNVFNLDLSTQFTDVSDLTINQVSVEQIPYWVIQKQYCSAYDLTFTIDTNNSKFFEQLLTNYKIQMNFSMNVDADVLNEAKVELTQDEYNEFINECTQQTSKIEFEFSNYETMDKSDTKISFPSSYYLNSAIGSYSNDEIIFYSLNNNVEYIDEPIKRLLSIDFNNQFVIQEQKVRFVYQVYGKEQQESEYEISTPVYGSDTFQVDYQYCTYYDDSKGEIVNQVNGIDGFYSPMSCSGYYEIVLKISFNNITKTFKFVNAFDFKGNDDYQNNKLSVSQTFINNLEYFTEVSF